MPERSIRAAQAPVAFGFSCVVIIGYWRFLSAFLFVIGCGNVEPRTINENENKEQTARPMAGIAICQ